MILAFYLSHSSRHQLTDRQESDDMGLQAKQSKNTRHRFDTDWKANKDAAASTSQDTSQPTQICQETRRGGQGRPSLFRMPIKEDESMSTQTKERD